MIWLMQSSPALTANISGVDLNGDGTSTTILPGNTFRSFGRDVSLGELQNLVYQYNQVYPTVVSGKRTVKDQTIPVITLPAGFSNGDTFHSHDIRVTRRIGFTENCETRA